MKILKFWNLVKLMAQIKKKWRNQKSPLLIKAMLWKFLKLFARIKKIRYFVFKK